ncbi:hypothetical protein AGR13a_Cc20012 [Agrobacterium genomosp. 13 str. CFBP 6927]|uniref:Uncharacterized protein n=1 Tax=Agrobacterium genomosp. 13 str. CFBP 6927 TaxID=1183428 RepID=A0ABP2BD54_9HYPH|nr:hypothetical protein AGR13a_Cc20012 [Agrobacterium genomosp. 13 str. CFBP 6927]
MISPPAGPFTLSKGLMTPDPQPRAEMVRGSQHMRADALTVDCHLRKDGYISDDFLR